MYTAIQCVDDRTGARGTFGFRTGRNTIHGIRFYSLTPVFNSCVELFNYMKENNIESLNGPVPTGAITL